MTRDCWARFSTDHIVKYTSVVGLRQDDNDLAYRETTGRLVLHKQAGPGCQQDKIDHCWLQEKPAQSHTTRQQWHRWGVSQLNQVLGGADTQTVWPEVCAGGDKEGNENNLYLTSFHLRHWPRPITSSCTLYNYINRLPQQLGQTSCAIYLVAICKCTYTHSFLIWFTVLCEQLTLNVAF